MTLTSIFILILFYISGKVYNYKINAEDNKLFLSQKHKFNDLIELIEFYKKNSAGLISNLKYPFCKKTDKRVFSTSNEMYSKLIIYLLFKILKKLIFSFLYIEKFTIERKDIEFFEKIGSGQFGVSIKVMFDLIKLIVW